MIRVENITKAFGTTAVLKGVSLTVNDGSVYGLIGRNGAGKTTLINIIAGISLPTSGACYINEHKVGKKTLSSGIIGYLTDLPAFFDYLTGEEYLRFLLSAQDHRRTVEERKNELLHLVDLDGKKLIRSMSRGMKQRLGIAAALTNDPNVILLDEPTSALDPFGRKEFMDIVRRLKDRGKCIVLSTHVLADMESVCDSVGFLNNGTVSKEISLTLPIFQSNEFIARFHECIRHEDWTGFAFDSIETRVMDDYSILIKCDPINGIASQRQMFELLSHCNSRLKEITTARQTLDEIFSEVLTQ